MIFVVLKLRKFYHKKKCFIFLLKIFFKGVTNDYSYRYGIVELRVYSTIIKYQDSFDKTFLNSAIVIKECKLGYKISYFIYIKML